MPGAHPAQSQEEGSTPRILILGGGFGGLWATRALDSVDAAVVLVDRHNHHLFQPLLYQVATAGLAAPSIAAPLRYMLRRQDNVTVLQGTATAIDLAARTVLVDGRPLHYDRLIVTTGSTHSYFGRDEWAAHAPGLKTLDDALGIRERILTAFERAEAEPDAEVRDEWLTFVVVGAGPTGVELAGTLAEIARHTLPREFRRIDPATARILLVEAGPRVLPGIDESLSVSAQRQLERLGVTVWTGRPVTDITAHAVTLGSERIAARTVLWAAGVQASALGRQLGAPLDRAGRVRVEPDLTLPGHPEVHVIGDLAHVLDPDTGRPVPAVAPAAKQMGSYAGRAIRASLLGKTPQRPFRYRDHGTLATIGRRAAVVELPRLRLRGRLAWWFWVAVHLIYLIGFRNRLVVLIDWAWAYFTYARAARIVISDPSDTGGTARAERG
jgi:NADH:ubiquinone reductase (H+-translocating)